MQNRTVWAGAGMSSHKAAAVLLCPHTLPHWISHTATGAEEECSDTTDHPLSCFIMAHSLPTYWWPRPFLVSPMASYLSLCAYIGRDKTVSSWRCRNQGKELLGMCLCARKVGNQGEVHWKLEEVSRERNLGKQLLWTPHLLERQAWELNQGPAPRDLCSKKFLRCWALGVAGVHGAGWRPAVAGATGWQPPPRGCCKPGSAQRLWSEQPALPKAAGTWDVPAVSVCVAELCMGSTAARLGTAGCSATPTWLTT